MGSLYNRYPGPSAISVDPPAGAQTNNPVTITLATPTISTAGWNLSWISWSYSGSSLSGAAIVITWTDPIAGSCTETYNITSNGPGILNWPTARRFPDKQAVTITLNAGGSGISGTLYCGAWVD